MESVFFYVLGGVAIVSALLMIGMRNPVHSALALVVTLFSVAGLFALLHAHFIAAVQILVYAGAVMVLFLFVIMLLNVGGTEGQRFRPPIGFGIAAVTVLALVSEVIIAVGSARGYGGKGVDPVDQVERLGNSEVLGKLLYTDYLFPFEVASLILLVAILGAMVLAKRRTP